MNGGANIFELYVAMYDAACAHDIARVREIQRRIMQISTSVYTVGKYGSSYLKGVKCALSLLGVCDDYLLVSLPEIPHRGAPGFVRRSSAGRQLQRITHNNQPSWR